MARQTTFATELQLVNFVLNQTGEGRKLNEINTESEDAYTAYVSLAYRSCVNEVFGMHDWIFAATDYQCVHVEDEPLPTRCKSLWKLPDDVGEYNHISHLHLRDDLSKTHGRHLKWWMLQNGNIATNFNTDGVLHLDTAVFAEVIAKPDIATWGACFCNLIMNILKRPIVMENMQDTSAWKFSAQQDTDLFYKAVEEDDLLDGRPWKIDAY